MVKENENKVFAAIVCPAGLLGMVEGRGPGGDEGEGLYGRSNSKSRVCPCVFREAVNGNMFTYGSLVNLEVFVL